MQLVARPFLVWRLLATEWQGRVVRQLAAKPREIPDLMLAHWWAELGSGVGCCGVWDLMSACWWVGPVPYTDFYCSQDVPELVLAHW